jgi:hypothetical protein
MFWKRKPPHDVGAKEPCLVAVNAAGEQLNRIGIEYVGRKFGANKLACGRGAQASYTDKPFSYAARNLRVVFGAECERIRGVVIIGVGDSKEPASGKPYSKIDGFVLSAVLLDGVRDRKVRGCFVLVDGVRRVIRRAIVDDDPFEIAVRLFAQALVQDVQKTPAVVGGGEYCEFVI